MSDGTDAYAGHIRDKERIGEEYSGQDTESVPYTFRIKGERIGLKVRRIKGMERLVNDSFIWGRNNNDSKWGTAIWGKDTRGSWTTVFEINNPS